MRTRLTVTAALAALALAGCGSASTTAGSSPSPSDASTPSASPSTTPPTLPSSSPTVPPPVDDAVPEGLEQRPEVKAALADAAGRAGIVATTVQVAGYQQVEWADGSLGCPQKGMSYTQMTVQGERLVLSAGQRTMEYHARLGGGFTYCATPGR